MKNKIPPLKEFIDLSRRRADNRHGYNAMENKVTVAVYETATGVQTLTIRISADLAEKFGLAEGSRLTCHIHPDQKYIALTPSKDAGAALFKPQYGRSLVYQTTLRGMLEAQPAKPAEIEQLVDEAIVITL